MYQARVHSVVHGIGHVHSLALAQQLRGIGSIKPAHIPLGSIASEALLAIIDRRHWIFLHERLSAAHGLKPVIGSMSGHVELKHYADATCRLYESGVDPT